MDRKKIKFILGSALIVGTIGYLIGTGINSTSTYFFTVSELMDQKVASYGTGMKVKGNVVEGALDKQGVFHANTLLTSCPSKYEAEKEAGKTHPGTLPGYKSKPELDLKKINSLPKTTV